MSRGSAASSSFITSVTRWRWREEEINAFVTSLAVDGPVSASTQTQALSALLFLYRHVLEKPLPDLDTVIRAKRPGRLPTVLTRNEVRRVLGRMNGTPQARGDASLRHGHAPARVPAPARQGPRVRQQPHRRARHQGRARPRRPVSRRRASGASDLALARPPHPPRGSRGGFGSVYLSRLDRAQVSRRRTRVGVAVRLSRRAPEPSTPARRRSRSASGPPPATKPSAVITCTRPASSAPSARPSSTSASRAASAATPSATPSRPTCSKRGTIFGRSRSCSDIGT